MVQGRLPSREPEAPRRANYGCCLRGRELWLTVAEMVAGDLKHEMAHFTGPWKLAGIFPGACHLTTRKLPLAVRTPVQNVAGRRPSDDSTTKVHVSIRSP